MDYRIKYRVLNGIEQKISDVLVLIDDRRWAMGKQSIRSAIFQAICKCMLLHYMIHSRNYLCDINKNKLFLYTKKMGKQSLVQYFKLTYEL